MKLVYAEGQCKIIYVLNQEDIVLLEIPTCWESLVRKSFFESLDEDLWTRYYEKLNITNNVLFIRWKDGMEE